MAAEFPDCEFFGVDLCPLHPDQVVPSNCTFQKHDILHGEMAAAHVLALDAAHSLAQLVVAMDPCQASHSQMTYSTTYAIAT